ncbi:hypothetical protein ACWGI8_12890 [Streptomyces sp. NPDC054841]
MVMLGQQTSLVRHRGPSPRKLTAVIAAAVVLVAALTAVLIHKYNDRPPWGDDIAYEAGYVKGMRIRKSDPSGKWTKDLLSGGCARMESEGLGGRKATHNPGLWVAGCLDGAAGRASNKQGLFY